MAKNTKEPQEPQPDGKKSKVRIVAIVLVVLVLLGAGFAYAWFKTDWIGPSPDATPVPAQSATSEPPLAEKTVHIDSITVNLAQNSGFLKVALSVQFGPDVDQAQFSTSAINDEIIKLYSRLTVQELSDPAFKEVAKDHLRKRLNELYGENAVSAVYYTEFVTQSA